MSLEAIEPFVSLGMAEAAAGPDEVALDVPLDGNRNDKGTLFGGSMYSAMLLAGWRLCGLQAARMGDSGDTYVKSSSVEFLRPILSDMRAVARLAGPPYRTPRGNLAFDVDIDALDAGNRLCGRARASFRMLGKKTR